MMMDEDRRERLRDLEKKIQDNRLKTFKCEYFLLKPDPDIIEISLKFCIHIQMSNVYMFL